MSLMSRPCFLSLYCCSTKDKKGSCWSISILSQTEKYTNLDQTNHIKVPAVIAVIVRDLVAETNSAVLAAC